MLSNTSVSLINAATRILRTLVKILLRNGIDYGTFAEVIRKVYVDVAFDYIKESGKRPTISSISAITGLTRKEAKRLKELDMPKSEVTHQRYNRAIRVISGWLNDSRFLDAKSQPVPLPVEGGENSFANLVKSYSGDIPPTAMLTVLEASNSIVRDGDYVKLIQHAYIPESDPVEKIEILGADVSEFIETINHNLSSPADQLLFQRKVSNIRVKSDAVPVFKKLAAQKSQELLEELDSFLSKNESTDTTANYVALGIFYAEKTSSPAAPEHSHEAI
jgi:hypothetical protein